MNGCTRTYIGLGCAFFATAAVAQGANDIRAANGVYIFNRGHSPAKTITLEAVPSNGFGSATIVVRSVELSARRDAPRGPYNVNDNNCYASFYPYIQDGQRWLYAKTEGTCKGIDGHFVRREP